MNFKQLANNTAGLGFWGVLTLYEMAFRMVLGMMILFEADYFDSLVVLPVLGAGGAAATVGGIGGSPASAPLSRMAALQMIVVGVLFGMMGSVSDPKTRQRLSAFTMMISVLECGFATYLLVTRTAENAVALWVVLALSAVGFLMALVEVSLEDDPHDL
ncbi:MAG TPA: hypothetical protein VJB16_06530, partial [archaeon]|nr:hypothetical protein [archaeon]